MRDLFYNICNLLKRHQNNARVKVRKSITLDTKSRKKLRPKVSQIWNSSSIMVVEKIFAIYEAKESDF